MLFLRETFFTFHSANESKKEIYYDKIIVNKNCHIYIKLVRLGAVHSVVFGGFASKELATRIKHAQPKVKNYYSKIFF